MVNVIQFAYVVLHNCQKKILQCHRIRKYTSIATVNSLGHADKIATSHNCEPGDIIVVCDTAYITDMPDHAESVYIAVDYGVTLLTPPPSYEVGPEKKHGSVFGRAVVSSQYIGSCVKKIHIVTKGRFNMCYIIRRRIKVANLMPSEKREQ